MPGAVYTEMDFITHGIHDDKRTKNGVKYTKFPSTEWDEIERVVVSLRQPSARNVSNIQYLLPPVTMKSHIIYY